MIGNASYLLTKAENSCTDSRDTDLLDSENDQSSIDRVDWNTALKKGSPAMALKKMLGEILADLGVVSHNQVKEALRRQRETLEGRTLPDRMERSRLVAEARFSGRTDRIPLLGQILADMKIITEDELKDALNLQNKMIQKYCDLDCGSLCSVMDMGTRVNSSLNLAEVLSMIMHNANRVTGSEASTLMLVDETTGDLFFSVPTGPKAGTLLDVKLKKGQGIAGWVVENERPVMVDNVEEDPRFYPGIDRMSGFQTRSILAVPLKAKGKIIGVLEVLNKADGSTFTEEDALLLTIFSEQAAMAIENARLYEELKVQVEETRRMHEKLVEARKFQALAQLSSGLAHDFKNILNAIMGFAEIILLDVESAQIREDVQEILKAGGRAKDLLEQILKFTRQSEQSKILLDSKTAIRQAAKSSRGKLHEGIEIIEDLSSEDAYITADPSQFHQILLDLLKNAGEAIGKDSGKIRIESEVVALNEEDPGPRPFSETGRYVKILVVDDGCGMDEETIKQIFEPYFSTKKRGVGTGMSLAAAEGIVKGHGGSIEVSSAVGEGTTFELLFPLAAEKKPEKETESVQSLPGGKEHILIIDDEEPLVAILERMLGHLGYQVTSSNSSEKALEIFRRDPMAFDLIISDLTMPVISGDKLAKKMMEARADTKVIIWTAFSEGINEERFKNIGIRACLDKPVIMSELALTVRRVLDED